MYKRQSLGYKDEAFIRDNSGNIIESGQEMKVLGFHFTNTPTVSKHVEAVCRKLRQRYWILLHLRNFGFSESELVHIYKAC